MKKINVISWILSLSVIAVIGGCYPQGATYTDEVDLVVSVQRAEVDYQAYNTFYIEDTVVKLSNNENDKILDPSDAAFLVGEFQMRLIELGWVEVPTLDTNNLPDAVVTMTVLENVNASYVSGGWGYGGWYGWGYWGYPGGGYYPGYGGCCYTSVYTYTTGTLIIEMLDPSKIVDEGATKLVPIIWGGGINGYSEGSKSNIRTRVKRGMDQIVKDSPYLKQN